MQKWVHDISYTLNPLIIFVRKTEITVWYSVCSKKSLSANTCKVLTIYQMRWSQVWQKKHTCTILPLGHYYFSYNISHDICIPPQILMSTPTTSTLSSPTTSCCENGRPIMTDPHTGQTVCSCQYGSGLLSAYSRVPSLTDSVYSAGPYGSQSYMPLGTDPSAFYSPLVSLIPPLASLIHFNSMMI